MLRRLQSILGPRVPDRELRAHRPRYLLPTVLMAAAAALLLASFTQQYWTMTLFAPQYPKGLHVSAHLNRLDGDVREIDSLNHYIGMRPLNDAATLERTLSPLAIATLSLLVAGTIAIHTRWAALLALPAVLFPGVFLLDLHLWLNHFGQNLDPHAALSSSIKPFTPPVLGEGMVGQFKTVASPGAGLWMAVAASGIVLIGLFFHRRAYKPLVDAAQADALFDELAPAGSPPESAKYCTDECHGQSAAGGESVGPTEHRRMPRPATVPGESRPCGASSFEGVAGCACNPSTSGTADCAGRGTRKDEPRVTQVKSP